MCALCIHISVVPRILGGQNTSASLRKILADALQALPRDDRTKQRSGVWSIYGQVETMLTHRGPCPRRCSLNSLLATDEVYDRWRKNGPWCCFPVAIYKNIMALKSKVACKVSVVAIVGINAITKKLHYYTLFIYD